MYDKKTRSVRRRTTRFGMPAGHLTSRRPLAVERLEERTLLAPCDPSSSPFCLPGDADAAPVLFTGYSIGADFDGVWITYALNHRLFLQPWAYTERQPEPRDEIVVADSVVDYPDYAARGHARSTAHFFGGAGRFGRSQPHCLRNGDRRRIDLS